MTSRSFTSAFGLILTFGLAGILTAQTGKSVAPGASQSTNSTMAGAESVADHKWPFRIVIVPDSQRYTMDRIYESDPRKTGDDRPKLTVPERNRIWEQMMQWVADNAESRNIKLLLHLGDIVEHGRERKEYEMIERGIAKLDGKVPYLLALGNHDKGKLANEFFPVSRNPLNKQMFGGERVEGSISDLYAKLTINGRKYLILTLGYAKFHLEAEQKGGSRRLDWANQVVKDHPDHKVIFVTHAMLADSTIQGGTPLLMESGQYLFDHFLKKHSNMYMTFCGHVYDRSGDGVATGYRKDLGEAGNPIHSTLFNSQWIDTNGGDGWMRIVEFHKDGKVVHKTYSPYLDQWNHGAGFEFEIPAE